MHFLSSLISCYIFFGFVLLFLETGFHEAALVGFTMETSPHLKLAANFLPLDPEGWGRRDVPPHPANLAYSLQHNEVPWIYKFA